MRATASISISLGIMSIPVKLYLSAKSEQISFNMINPATGNRVKQLLVDAGDVDEEGKVKSRAKPLNRSDTLKGYEYEKDKFITFTAEEIANMQADKRDTLVLKEFVPADKVSPLQIEKTLYTAPDKSDRQYKILQDILSDKKLAAVGTWVARGKEHLVIIQPSIYGLLVHQMFYNSEMRAFENKCADVEVTEAELGFAEVMVDSFTKDELDLSSYSDTFHEKVSAAVQTKLNGGTIDKIKTKNKKPKRKSVKDVKAEMRANFIASGVPEDQVDAMVNKALKAGRDRSKRKKAS